VRTLLVANLTTRKPATGIDGSLATLPTLLAGQQWKIGLRFTELEEGVYSEVRPAIYALRASIGPVDARPLAGTYRLVITPGLQMGVVRGSAGSEITSALAYNATASQVAAALNAVIDVEAGEEGYIRVKFESGSYLIQAADGSSFELEVANNLLVPTSAAQVRGYMVDGKWVNELRLVQAPYAFSDSAAQALADPPYVETVVDGFTSSDGTWFVDEVQDLIIGPGFRGTYRLSLDYGGGVANTGLPRRTAMLSLEDGPDEVTAALNAILKDLPVGEGTVVVTNPSNNVARITFGGDLSGVDLPPLTVEAFPAPGDVGDWTFTLDLNRVEFWAALRQQDNIVVPFEVEADIIDAEAGDELRTVKLWSVPVTLARPLLYEGLAEAQSIDWLRPISPRSYIPFSPDQIITGQQHYVGTVTIENSPTERFATIDHNLNTEAVHVTVRRNVTPGDTVIPSRVTIEGSNSITLVFSSEQNGGVFAVLITAAGPTSVFQAHTHTTAQVLGLEDIIGALAVRMTALERLLPRSGALTVGQTDKPVDFKLPVVGEVLPDLNFLNETSNVASQIFAVVGGSAPPPPIGTAAEAELARQKDEAADQDPDKMPSNILFRAVIPGIGEVATAGRPAVGTAPEVPPEPAAPLLFPAARGSRLPVLLQAVPATEVFDTTVLPEGAALVDGRVYRYTGTDEFFVPGDNGRPSLPLLSQGLFAYRQGNYYRVKAEGGSVYYPREFERELWRSHLSSEQMVNGATLQVSGSLRFRLIGEFFDAIIQKRGSVDLAAQYTLFVEAIMIAEGASIGTVASTTILATQKLVFSPVLSSFNWRLMMKRDGNLLTSSFMAFSKTITTTFSQAPFILRLRLGAFDIDDLSNESPRGQIALIMPQTKLDVTL
jgi:hypothetical protein